MDNKELPQGLKGILSKGKKPSEIVANLEKQLAEKDAKINEQAEQIEKLKGLLKEQVTKGRFPVHGEPEWESYCKEKGI